MKEGRGARGLRAWRWLGILPDLPGVVNRDAAGFALQAQDDLGTLAPL
jgi:hypothetical protein